MALPQVVTKVLSESLGVVVVSNEIYVVAMVPLFVNGSDDIVGLTDYLLATAIDQQASDLHLEFGEQELAVRLRIDGALSLFTYLSREQGMRVFSRLKVLMGLDVTKIAGPQDGGLRIKVKRQLVDVRASFFPSLHGEKVVVRFLGGQEHMVQLHTLPFSPVIRQALHTIALHDQGLFLVTGPTGSGKTTTLYALLQAVDRERRNVVTLEDPIEYHIERVTQTQVYQPGVETFAHGLRSLLRQDPDVALIGELRDADTVHSAIEAALTGHLVFSSLHTGSACGVPIRLREMGIEPYLIAHALKGVLAQRLIMVLCPACTVMTPMDPMQKEWAAHNGLALEQTGVARGCSACRYTGIGGQTVIGELWQCDSSVVVQLLQNPSSTQADFERIAAENGMIPLSRSGLNLVQEGKVAIAELIDRAL